MSFLVCNHLVEEEEANCFNLFVFLMSCSVILPLPVTDSVLWLFRAIPWVGLQIMFVIWFYHAHLFFGC